MAKGFTCPSCGEYTFHRSTTGLHECSECGARGWPNEKKPPAGKGGGGKVCQQCGEKTLHGLGSWQTKRIKSTSSSKWRATSTVSVRRCNSCKAVVIEMDRPKLVRTALN